MIKGSNGIANSVNSIRHLIMEANTLNANTMNYDQTAPYQTALQGAV